MMWPVGSELLVTLSNMQRVMQSLPQRRVSHAIWPSLQNTCLLRSWLQRHALQTLLGPEDQDSSGTSYSPGVHWPGCCITSDSAGLVTPPMACDQPPVSRGQQSAQCPHDAIPGQALHRACVSWSQLPAPLTSWAALAPCCMFRKYSEGPNDNSSFKHL